MNRYDWFEALQSEGSQQIKILRDFLEAMKLHQFEPCQEILIWQTADENREADRHLQACADKEKGIVCIYFPQEIEGEQDVKKVFEW